MEPWTTPPVKPKSKSKPAKKKSTSGSSGQGDESLSVAAAVGSVPVEIASAQAAPVPPYVFQKPSYDGSTIPAAWLHGSYPLESSSYTCEHCLVPGLQQVVTVDNTHCLKSTRNTRKFV